MNYIDVNWKEKDIEEVNKYYDHLPQNEKFPFLKWLSSQYPELKFEWLDVFEDLRCEMTYIDNIAACEDFLTWYPKQYPDEYAHRYEFIERDLCDYYLKTGDLEKLRQRITFISHHPVSGIDTITIRLFFQLIYHGLYEDALNYARVAYKLIEDDESIWGNPEIYFVQGLYLDSLQKAYQSFKESGIADFKEVFSLAADIGIEENKAIFKIEKDALTNPLNPEILLNRVYSQYYDSIVELNVYFLKYMLDTYNIPFIVSEQFWNIVAIKGLFGKSKQNEDFFYVDVKTFSKCLDNRFDYSLGSNSLEMFGKIWALHYVFEFLEKNGLISTTAAELMRENNLYHRNEVIRYMGNELWQMNFVFSWPQNQLWSELKPVFESTYCKSFKESRVILTDFCIANPHVRRITVEMETVGLYEDQLFVSQKDDFPFKKDTPDYGRNDPCPCGSGKKFKKCCLDG